MRELAAGQCPAVVVDDSGSPGANLGLDPDRKTWVAVILSSSHAAQVVDQMPRALQELHLEVGATEFHFTEIYSGKGAFKSKPLETRLALFRFMAFIFQTYRLPILVQTFTPSEVGDLQRRGLMAQLPPFDLRRPNDCALFFVLIRAKWFLQRQMGSTVPARVFVDEGFKRNGLAISIPAWRSAFADGLICFARSDAVFPLQLADFAAFALNRSQILLAKPQLSDLDRELLRILEPLASLYQNIPSGVVDLSALGSDAITN